MQHEFGQAPLPDVVLLGQQKRDKVKAWLGRVRRKFAALLGCPLGCPQQPATPNIPPKLCPVTPLTRKSLCTAAQAFHPVSPLPAAGPAHSDRKCSPAASLVLLPSRPGCPGMRWHLASAHTVSWGFSAVRAIFCFSRARQAFNEGSRGIGVPLGVTGWVQPPMARNGDGVPGTDGGCGRTGSWAGMVRLGPFGKEEVLESQPRRCLQTGVSPTAGWPAFGESCTAHLAQNGWAELVTEGQTVQGLAWGHREGHPSRGYPFFGKA